MRKGLFARLRRLSKRTKPSADVEREKKEGIVEVRRRKKGVFSNSCVFFYIQKRKSVGREGERKRYVVCETDTEGEKEREREG